MLMDWIYNLVQNIGQSLLKLLPTSPFTDFIEGWTPPEYIGWLNWFFPVKTILTIMAVWLGAVSLFYLYSVIMRWVKLIGD